MEPKRLNFQQFSKNTMQPRGSAGAREELLHIMDIWWKQAYDDTVKALKREQRRRHLAQNIVRMNESRLEEANSDLRLARQILHEIFEDCPSIREAYRHVLEFDDLPPVVDQEEVEMMDLIFPNE
jgi:hypothetical protein